MKPPKIEISNTEIPHNTNAKTLGLTLTKSGILQHVSERINLAEVNLKN